MMTGKMPVTPTHGSYSPTDRRVNPSTFRNVPSSSERFFSGSKANSMPPANNLGRGPSGVGANRNNSSFEQGHSRPAWHAFTPPQPGNVNRSSPGLRSSSPAAENGSFPARNYQSQSSGQQGGWQHFTPSLRESHRAGLARLHATGEGRVLNQRLEMPAVRKDGSQMLAELFIHQLEGSDPPQFTGCCGSPFD